MRGQLTSPSGAFFDWHRRVNDPFDGFDSELFGAIGECGGWLFKIRLGGEPDLDQPADGLRPRRKRQLLLSNPSVQGLQLRRMDADHDRLALADSGRAGFFSWNHFLFFHGLIIAISLRRYFAQKLASLPGPS
jgi:hypothetical protein